MLKREAITGNDLNQTYKYTDSGNITEITDTPTNTALGGDTGAGARGEKQCFIYDNLARLKHAWTPALGTECGTGDPGNPALAGPAPYQVGYTYNPLNSNRESQTYRDGLTGVTETTNYAYTQTGNAGPHAVTSIAATSKATNGTETQLPARNFTYTATGGQETRTGTEIPEVAVPEPDVLDVDYTDGTPTDDAQGRAMTKHGTPAVIDDTTLDAARRTKLGLAGSKVAKFDGVDDAYSYAMGDSQWDKLTDEMSIECLMKDNGTLPNTTEHSACSAKDGGGASMVVYNGKLSFTIYTDGGYRSAQATITAGQWYHAIGTWDGDTARIYLDGQLAASVEAPGPLKRPANLGRNGFFVGADASSTTAGQFFSPVSVAKMGLYSQALSATEIAAIHNGARTAEGAAARRSVAQAMCWDREGKLVKTLTTGETCADGVVDELGEAEYVYTGAGERVIRADAEAVTVYLPGGQEVTIPRDSTRNVSAHRYYTFNGETIAVRDERGLGGVTSLVNDHHGTPIVAIPNTNWTPASVRKQYAVPFGASRGKEASANVDDRDANGTPGDRGFLGKSSDTTGLTQVGARYYDQSTGAFISPDPALDPAEPRHLNAYAYSYQSPVTNTDPTGLMTDIGGGGSRDSDSDCFPGSAGCGESGSSSDGSSSGSGSSGGGGSSEASGTDFTDAVEDYMQEEYGYTDREIEVFKNWIFDYSGCDASPEKCATGFDPFKKFGKLKFRWPLSKRRGKNKNVAPGHHVGDVLGDTSKLKGWIPRSIPKNAQYAIDDIAKSGVDGSQGRAGTHGFAGPHVPETFRNDGRNGAYVLPRTTPGGDAITYQERGVWQSLDNPKPGGERIVTGSDGSIYYSATHYQTFIVGATGK